MIRRLSGVLGLLCLGGIASLLAAADDPPKGPAAFNPENAFRRGDLNKDGKLSKDEFLKLMQFAPRLKDNPQQAEQLFRRLDSDGDGFLSLDEFRKIAALQKPMKPPEKPAEKKPPETPAPDGVGSPEALAFFEKKIRPVLVQSCYKCHSADSEKVKGGLVLDTREGVRKGGDSGPAVVPGDVTGSLLVKALRHSGDLKMPATKLADEVIADFERWVRMGAPDPRDGSARVVRQEIDIEKGRQFWAFQPPRKSAPPTVKQASWARSDIDRFVLAGLEAKELKPVADADPHTLIRRLSFDLVGLPPTPEEVDAFVAAYQRQPQVALQSAVDRLLDSPHFGERWGRHWLDVVRYAESSGLQTNFNHPHAWRYRDYVIAAFNSDKPFDRFLKEQLAGDLLPAANDRQKAELAIATGFLALGPKQLNERNPQQFLLELADEQIDVTFQAFQGLTVACARCHDHKFDPIPQKDYYALAGIFRSTETCYGTVRLIQNSNPAALVSLPAGVPVAVEAMTKEARARIEKQRDDARKALQDLTPQERFGTMQALRLRVQMQQAEARLAGFESDGTPKLLAMGTRERSFPGDSKLYIRGELDKPGEVVARGFPQVLTTTQPSIKQGSGRLELAEWLASRDNPLTARVMVNRIWLHLMGRGLVATPDNFGSAGQLPANQGLLDHLAVSFMDSGWSMKKAIRQIVLSRVYQLGSSREAKNYEIDPDNALVWRQTRRRLQGEAVRDALLAVSGQLETKPPVGSVVARAGEGLIGFARPQLVEANRSQVRSVYLPVIRDLVPEPLALFDFAEPSLVIGERASTTVPAQALFLLNNPFVLRQAEVTAERLLLQSGSDGDRIRYAYRLFFGRPATTREVEQAQQFLSEYVKTLGASPGKATDRAAWSALCQAFFASADFLYRN